MKSIIYCRVSTKKQSEGDKYSLDDQEDYGRRFFQTIGISDPEVIRDIFTGDSALEERPGGSRLSEMIGAGLVANLYIKVTDRLFRNSGAAMTYAKTFVAKGVRLYVDGSNRDLSKPDDKMLYGFQTVMDDAEREKIIRRTAGGLKKMRDAGKAHSTRAYGFQALFDPKGNKTISEDPVEGPVLRQIFRLRADGQSVTTIVESLETQGIPSKKGQQTWHPNVINHILKNPIYIGKVKDSDGQLVESTIYPTLLDLATWEAAQKTTELKDSTLYFKKASQPLSAILRCPICNAPFNSAKRTYKEKTYLGYVHNLNKSKFNKVQTWSNCKHPVRYFRKEAVDEPAAHAWLVMALPFNPVSESFYDSLQRKIDLDGREYEALKSRHQSSLAEIEVKQGRIRNAILEGIDPSLFRDEAKELNRQSKVLDDLLAQNEKQLISDQVAMAGLKAQFNQNLIADFVLDQRAVYQKTVYFLAVASDRIELWLRSPNRLVAFFDPQDPRSLRYYEKDEGTVVEVVYSKLFDIPKLWSNLQNGMPVDEAIKRLMP